MSPKQAAAGGAWDEKAWDGEKMRVEMAFHDGWFGYTDYNKGNTCLLVLKGPRKFGDTVENRDIWVRIGDKFKPCDAEGNILDKGRYCVWVDPETGEPDFDRTFSDNAQIQEWIRKARDLNIPVNRKGDGPRDAMCWVGSKVVMEQIKKGKGQYETTWDVPVEYLGEESGPQVNKPSDSGSKSASGSSSSSGSKTEESAGESGGSSGGGSGGGNGDVKGILVELAKEADGDQLEYIKAVRQDDRAEGIKIDNPLVEEVWESVSG